MATADGGVLVNYTAAYYQFVERVLNDHSCRYGGQCLTPEAPIGGPGGTSDLGLGFQQGDSVYKMKHAHHQVKTPQSRNKTVLYDTVSGYYSTDQVCIAVLARKYDNDATIYKDLYTNLGQIVHKFPGKKFVLSPYIDLNIMLGNYSVDQHRDGFEILAQLKVVDVIAVQEGRGCAKGCYYWESQQYLPIANVDPVLDEINHYLIPGLRENATYYEMYRGSNNEVNISWTSIQHCDVKCLCICLSLPVVVIFFLS